MKTTLQHIVEIQFELLAIQRADTLSLSTLKLLMDQKKNYHDNLKTYLIDLSKNPDKFKQSTNPHTLLGKMIDLQRSQYFKTSKTKTREFVETLSRLHP